MITDKIKLLSTTKARIAKLEAEIAANLSRELASLHAKYGFAEVDVFLMAVEEAAGGKTKKRRGRPAKAVAAKKGRKRAKISPKIRAKVKQLVKAGKTGSQIAKAVGISLPSVQ